MKRLILLLLTGTLILSSCSPKEDTRTDILPPKTTEEKASSNEPQSTEENTLDTSSVQLGEGDIIKMSSEKKLTMLNIWGTFCSPCLEEMPALGEIANEYKDKDFQIVGLVIDVMDNSGKVIESQMTTAKEIIAKTNANYKHIIPNEKIIDNTLKDISVVPTTIFLDNNGKQVGSSVVGAKSKTDWIKEIDSRLKEIN